MSTQRKREWWVTGWSRPRPDAREPDKLRVTDEEGRPWLLIEEVDGQEDKGAQIIDMASRVTYRVTVERRGRNVYLSSLHIDAPPGVKVDSRFLSQVPTGRLAEAADQYLRAAAESGPGHIVILPPEAVAGRGFVPDLDELAARLRETSRIELVAAYQEEYGVSRSTVDRWIRAARDAGLIEEAETGRPRKDSPTAPGGGANEKEKKR